MSTKVSVLEELSKHLKNATECAQKLVQWDEAAQAQTTATNNERVEICAHCQSSDEFLIRAMDSMYRYQGWKFCPWCGRKLSPVS